MRPDLADRLDRSELQALCEQQLARGVPHGALIVAACRWFPPDVSSPIAMLRKRFEELRPAKAARPPCLTCHGEGFAGEDDRGRLIRCPACKPATVSRSPRRSSSFAAAS